jgi:microcystin-dependent protein
VIPIQFRNSLQYRFRLVTRYVFVINFLSLLIFLIMEPFLGQICLFGFNFAPRGWALCNGQLMSIAQNTALFSLLGTTYGGDGNTTFALPNLQGRVPIHQGAGPGLSPRNIGEMSGWESITLTHNEMPAHNHPFGVSSQDGTSSPMAGTVLAKSTDANGDTINGFVSGTPDIYLSSQSIFPAGNNFPHENMQPYLVVNYCIATEGIFPSRS